MSKYRGSDFKDYLIVCMQEDERFAVAFVNDALKSLNPMELVAAYALLKEALGEVRAREIAEQEEERVYHE